MNLRGPKCPQFPANFEHGRFDENQTTASLFLPTVESPLHGLDVHQDAKLTTKPNRSKKGSPEDGNTRECKFFLVQYVPRYNAVEVNIIPSLALLRTVPCNF